MKTRNFFKTFLLLVVMIVCARGSVSGQADIDIAVRTTFNYYLFPCDSIVVVNQTQGTTCTLFYPDTILSNHHVGIDEYNSATGDLQLRTTGANPFRNETEIAFTLLRPQPISIFSFNALGQMEMSKQFTLDAGEHTFAVSFAHSGLHLLGISTQTESAALKLIQQSAGSDRMERTHSGSSLAPKNGRGNTRTYFDFAVGDQLTFTSYATINYHDTTMQIAPSKTLTVAESGTLVLKESHWFDDGVIEANTLMNTTWEVLDNILPEVSCDNDGFYTDTANFGAEARVTFYDTTFTNERVNGYCDALWDYAMELGWHPRGLAVWSYSEYQTQKKYTIHPNSDTINNTICARLYECYMDEPYSDIEDGVYYFVNYLYDFNTILFRVWSGEGAATCVFRRVGGVR